MVPATSDLAPLPSRFLTVADFRAGTMTLGEAIAYCKANPGWQRYGLRKEGETRFAVRPIGAMVADGRKPEEFDRVEPTIRERMDRIKAEGRAPVTDAGPMPQKGIRREIWDAYDRLFAEKGQFTKADAAHILLNYNNSTCGVVFGEWKRYHGHDFKMK
jgi:hypothetical protein